MALIVIKQPERLQEALLIGGTELRERLKEVDREVEGAWSAGYARFLSTRFVRFGARAGGRSGVFGTTPVRLTFSRSSQDSE